MAELTERQKLGIAIDEILKFRELEPTEIETNVGTIWFKDTVHDKMMAITIIECEEQMKELEE